jgi:hypothetical protein
LARTLWYRGFQVGDGVVKIEPGLAPQTPPGIQTALFFDTAEVVSQSHNYLYKLTVHVHLKKADELAFSAAAEDLQELAGVSGTLEIRDGSTVKRRWSCTLMPVGEPDVLDGFGGRFTASWPLLLCGGFQAPATVAMPIYELNIDGQVIVRSGTAPAPSVSGFRVSLVSYECAYDAPAKLTIRCDCDWRTPPCGRDAVVEFRVDGTGRFVGNLNGPKPFITAGNQRYVTYEALDLTDLAARKFPANQYGNYSFALKPKPLSQVVDQWLSFQQVQDQLDECGIDTEVGYVGGAETVECFPVSLDAQSLDAGFRAIAEAAPGVGVRLDCTIDGSSTLPRYQFVNLFGAAAYDLSIDRVRMEKLDIAESIEGRCGAVQTLAGSTQGEVDETIDRREDVSPNWTDTLEANWALADAGAVDEAGAANSKARVFREYTFAEVADAPTADMTIVVEKQVIRDDDEPDNNRWKPVEVLSIDFENKTFILKEPAVRTGLFQKWERFNTIEAGRCQGKGAAVRLCWSSQQGGHIQINIPSVRFPTLGFSGRVAQLYGVRGRTVRLMKVPAGVDRARWPAFAHAQLSEPEYSGEIPIVGDLPVELWGLARRVNLKSISHGLTGYESLFAPVKGISVNFEAGGSASVQLSRDTTERLKEASA